MKLGVDVFSLRFNDWTAFDHLDYAHKYCGYLFRMPLGLPLLSSMLCSYAWSSTF